MSFLPQAHSVPSRRTATVCPKPAAAARHLPPPSTGTGLARSAVEPSPSWPAPLEPHAHSVPLRRTATVCTAPPATVRHLLPAPTCTGLARSVVEPSPSWPDEFRPQAHRVPSLFSTKVCEGAAATALGVAAQARSTPSEHSTCEQPARVASAGRATTAMSIERPVPNRTGRDRAVRDPATNCGEPRLALPAVVLDILYGLSPSCSASQDDADAQDAQDAGRVQTP